MRRLFLLLCSAILPLFLLAQPPNNTTCTATTVTVGAGSEFGESCTPSTIYSWVGATDKGLTAEGLNCQLYNGAKTTWYKFTVPGSGDFVVSLAPADGIFNTDFLGGYQFALFSADKCATVNAPSYYCTPYLSPTGNLNYPSVTIRNQTPGATHYLALWREGGGANGTVKMCIAAVPQIAPSNQRVGIGIANPRKNLDVNGSLHVQGDLTIMGKLGIGTSQPGSALDINGRLRIKANSGVGNETAGIWLNRLDNTTGAVFLGMANDSIFGVYGNFGSDWLGFNMNKNSGLVTLGKGFRSAHHLGRYTIRKDPATAAGETAGIWLGNNAGSANASFLGLYNDNVVGFYGAAGANWGLTMNNNNGYVGIGLGGNAATAPLQFSNTIGLTKISLYKGTYGDVGIGVYGGELRLQNDIPGGKVSMGVLETNGNYTELAKAERSSGFAFSILGNLWVNGTTYASDGRFKTNIEPLQQSLDKVLQLQGVSYQMKAEEFPHEHFDTATQVGLVAQDVEKIVPEVVSTGPNGYKAIDYAKLVPLLIESIKAQQAILEKQQEEIERLKKHQRRGK